MAVDVIVRAGRVLDGSGAPPRTADVAVRDGHIVDVGRIRERARRVIDADGALVVPGAIALLPPADVAESDPNAAAHTAPGVTTAVELLPSATVTDAPAYLGHLGDGSFLIDRTFLLDHGALRSEVMGNKVRDGLGASPGDLARMAELVAAALRAGVRGLRSAVDHGDGAERRSIIGAALGRTALATGEVPWFTAYLEPDPDDLDVEAWRHRARALLGADPGPGAVVVASKQAIDDPKIFTALRLAEDDPTRLLSELGGGRAFAGPGLNPLALLGGSHLDPDPVAAQSATAADAFGLDDRGRLVAGRRADLNVLDSDHLTTNLTSGVVSTLVGGVEIVSEDELVEDRPGRIR